MRPSMKKRKEKEDEAEEDDEEEKETLCACMCLWYYGESKKADRKNYILLSLLYSWAGLFCLAIRLLFFSVYHCVCVCVSRSDSSCASHAHSFCFFFFFFSVFFGTENERVIDWKNNLIWIPMKICPMRKRSRNHRFYWQNKWDFSKCIYLHWS